MSLFGLGGSKANGRRNMSKTWPLIIDRLEPSSESIAWTQCQSTMEGGLQKGGEERSSASPPSSYQATNQTHKLQCTLGKIFCRVLC